MTIRKFGDNHPDIVLQCSLRSITEITSAGGVLAGTASSDSNGLNSGSAGSCLFSGYSGYDQLAESFQISLTVTSVNVGEYDDSPRISGSLGVDAGNRYIMCWGREDNTNEGRVYVDDNARIVYRSSASDTSDLIQISTIGKGESVTLTLSADDSNIYIYADGALQKTSARTAGWASDLLYDLTLGANYGGIGQTFGDGYFLTNLVVAKNSPVISAYSKWSVSIFGDSFCAHSLETPAQPRYDAISSISLARSVYKNTTEHIDVDGSGHGGFTICDTGSSDLSDQWSTFLSSYNGKTIVLFGGNNDANVATDLQVTDVATGVYANLTSWLDDAKIDGRRLFVIYGPGSLRQDTTLDTTDNNNRRKLVMSEIIRAAEDWRASNSGMQVIVRDLFGLLGGDYDNNINYQGHLNTIGNATVAGVADADDRHPSAYGHVALGKDIAFLITSMIPKQKRSGILSGIIR